MENERKVKLVIKLATAERKLSKEANYQTANFFTEYLLAIEMKKTQILVNKPVYSGLSILDISKTVMYEFWYNYIKP